MDGRENRMFNELQQINHRPKPFEYYTAADLWTDEHTSKQMLSCHLNGDIDLSSRSESFIEQSVAWIASQFRVGPTTTGCSISAPKPCTKSLRKQDSPCKLPTPM